MTKQSVRQCDCVPVADARGVWNFWLGGKDWVTADRSTALACAQIYPAIGALCAAGRAFQLDAVARLAAAGVDQFVEVGVGLPAARNTHEVAQAIIPTARVVYVDVDPVVLVHARALLRPVRAGACVEVLDADLRDTDRILTAAGRVVDLGAPVAVVAGGVLGQVSPWSQARDAVARLMGGLAADSYLVWWDGTDDDPDAATMWDHYSCTTAPAYTPRPPAQLRELFDDLHLDTTGLQPLRQNHCAPSQDSELSAMCAVARTLVTHREREGEGVAITDHA
ncbi:S-adenosyl methyltransferase [Nocardia puris]|uniref:S-adenosyl methyltransferase n=1 Tax=Nocardia puris TaxID=208602 RepID=A0A366D5H5_9NOCA|nr:S-adenosyl methyltransferase [Nocardia puris]